MYGTNTAELNAFRYLLYKNQRAYRNETTRRRITNVFIACGRINSRGVTADMAVKRRFHLVKLTDFAHG
jgi:hypothetical protein